MMIASAMHIFAVIGAVATLLAIIAVVVGIALWWRDDERNDFWNE